MTVQTTWPWQQTYRGHRFEFHNPKARMVDVGDIAHALSLQCRFNGHVREFYSVAQHCVHVSGMLPDHLALVGLLHDASEAYLGDLITPVKAMVPQFKVLEMKVEQAVADRFGFDSDLLDHPLVKHADHVMLATEASQLLDCPPRGWDLHVAPANFTLAPLGPAEAKKLFLTRFQELYHGT
jgi:5'-deoxynucleotidase YfbR-like HD superfamily hydrolase